LPGAERPNSSDSDGDRGRLERDESKLRWRSPVPNGERVTLGERPGELKRDPLVEGGREICPSGREIEGERLGVEIDGRPELRDGL